MHSSHSTADRQPSRRRRRLLRIATAAAGGVLLAYVLVPLMIPKAWLLQRISDRLTVLMNRQTTIASLELSYSRGLRITDLTIARRKGFGDGALFKAERMIMPLTASALWRPAELLWLASGFSEEPLDLVRIHNPKCWVVLNEQGGYNIADLNDRGGGRLPALAYEIDNLQLYLVDLARGDTPEATQRLILPGLSAQLDPQSGHMSWRGAKSGDEEPSESTIDLEGDLAVPRLRSGVPLGGGSTLQWKEVDLAGLPPLLLPSAPIESVSGKSSGSVKIELQSDLRVLFDARLTFNHGGLRLSGDRRVQLPERFTVEASGCFDANRDDMVIDELKCTAPGIIEIHNSLGSSTALRWSSSHLVELALRASILDASAIRSWWQWTDEEWGDLTCSGALGLTLQMSGEGSRRRFGLELDATGVSMQLPAQIDLSNHLEKRLKVTLEHDEDRIHLRDLRLAVGGTTITARGDWPASHPELPAPPHKWCDWLLGGRAQVDIQVDSINEVYSCIPQAALSRDFPGSGSLTAGFSVAPDTTGSQIEASLELPEQSRLTLRECLSKADEVPLSISGRARLVAESNLTLDDVQCELRSGELHFIAGSGNSQFSLETTQPQSSWDRDKLELGTAEAYLVTPYYVEGAERLKELFPPLNHWLGGSSTRTIKGNLSGDLELRAAIVDKVPMFRARCSADAGGLEVQFDDIFRKPAGDPLSASLDYTYDGRANQPFESTNVAIELDGGATQARFERIGDQLPKNQGLCWTAQVDALERFLEYWPAAQVATAGSVSGGAKFEISTYDAQSTQRWFVDLDLTPTVFAMADHRIHKEGNTPLRVHAAGRWTLSEDVPAQGRLDIDRLNATIAACEISTHQASATLGGTSARAGILELLMPTSQSQDIQLGRCTAPYEASIEFDDALFALLPPLSKSEWQLSGGLQATGEARLDNSSWFHRGSAVLDGLSIRAPKYMQKAPGVPATLEYALFTDPQDVDDPALYQIHVPQLRLFDAQQTLSLSGVLEWDQGTRLSDGPCTAQLVGHFESHNVGQLQDFVPVVENYAPSGQARATLQIVARDRHFRAEQGIVELDQFSATIGGQKVTLDGGIELNDQQIRTDALHIERPDLRALVVGTAPLSDSSQPAVLYAAVDKASSRQHRRWLRDALAAAPQTVQTLSAGLIPAQQIDDLLWQRPLSADLFIDSLRIAEPLNEMPYTLSNVHAQLSRHDDEYSWQITGALDGGLVDARAAGTAVDHYVSEYELLSVTPNESMTRCLKFGFPGLQTQGQIDYRWRLNADASEDGPLASGDLIIAGGKLLGKAAPGWVTRVFPTLDLAEFRFSHAHDWFNIYSQGRIHHRAIFDGKNYNLYADGWELPDHSAEHVIGIDLLAGFDSKTWTESRSGKIPLFRSISRLDDNAELIDEEVRYVPVQFVKALLVDNNPVTAAYTLLKQRISRNK